MKLVAKKLARKLKFAAWVLNGYVGKKQTVIAPEKVTVLITYFNPVRMTHIDHQVRNILKCDFVEKIILSNHNAEIKIENQVRVRDKRITFVNQETNRGCGYRWFVAQTYHPEYLIVIDDDILLFPWQLTQLFANLVNNPEIPHGITGMHRTKGGQFELIERENTSVDYLCEIYAVSGNHLDRYKEIREGFHNDERIGDMIDSAADFMVISESGNNRPHIHDVGSLFRCTSYNEPGIAVHKADQFGTSLLEVSRAVDNLKTQHLNAEMIDG